MKPDVFDAYIKLVSGTKDQTNFEQLNAVIATYIEQMYHKF